MVKINPPPFNHKSNNFRFMGTIFWIAVALSSGFSYGFRQVPLDSKQHEQSTLSELGHFGRAEYEQMRIGMSLTDVRSILNRGRGIEVSHSATMATFVWENPDGSKITATFEHDKLKSKEQSGLK